MAHRELASAEWRFLTVCFLVVALVLGFNPAANGQTGYSPPSNPLGPETLNKYPGLAPELGRLFERLQHDITFPPDRAESHLLQLLPTSTIAYFALPNYGGVARQALAIFHQELNDSPDLRAWWADSGMAKLSPKIEDSLERFSTVSEYLGDEIVISGTLDTGEPDLLVVAEVHKPGLRVVLQNVVLGSGSKEKHGVRILEPQQLATVTDTNPQQLVILVRPDFVVASNSLARLRAFSSHIDNGARDFSSTPFAQRILQSYAGGVSWVGGIDLEKVVAKAANGPATATFRQTGFADMKYAVWEHKQAGTRSISQAELSFTGPRHGIAAWLAAPQQLGSLDFVSPKAMAAISLMLESPARMFEDMRQLSALGPPEIGSIARMEQAFGISLQNDVLAQLSGEITLELDGMAPQPAWRAVLGVKDADRLQQTLSTILTHARVPTNQFSDAGVVYHTLSFPSAQGTNTIAYAFVDGYLTVTSSPDALSDALRLHKSGEPLGRSRRFLDSLPGGRTAMSAMVYEDPVAMMAARAQRLSPEQAQSMTQFAGKTTPMVVMCAYGEPDAIREASTNPGVDVGVVLAAAAIAIPNLLRARIAANEASAVGKLRAVNTAEVTYASSYRRGFAADLATLGPDPTNPNGNSPAHANLLNDTVAEAHCRGMQWCESSGYRFIVTGACNAGRCRDFVATATPVSSSTGTRNFCSTGDGVIRYQIAPPLTIAPTARDCKQWPPIE